MPATYEPITTTTLSSSVTSFTLSSIPGTYTDLLLVIDGAPITGGTSMDSNWQFNGDTGANYSDIRFQTNFCDRSNNATSSRFGQPQSVGRYIQTLHIMDYANTSIYKSTIARSGSGTSSVSPVAEIYGGLWRNTAAITSITVISGQARNYTSGTVVTLYGIKAA